MRRVIFVDDDPDVLDGLRDSLRKRRSDWEMVFSLGAESALQEFSAGQFDVIVTDMRMPGMDGAELLSKIQVEYPRTVRIILSGYAEPAAAVRSVRVAHQFLAKPCDAATIEIAVERACTLQGIVSSQEVREVVGRIGALPSPPEIYLQLTQMLAQPEVTISEIAALLERDMAMCAKLLQIVNSSFFGLPRRITRIDEAVNYLGHGTIRDLALAVTVFNTTPIVEGLSTQKLQRHAFLTGNIARRMTSGKLAEEAFVAGLLHDIGSLVMAAALPTQYSKVLAALRLRPRDLEDVESEIIGVTHGALGAYLLSMWGLPNSIVEAVCYHHHTADHLHPGLTLPVIVHVADLLAEEVAGESSIPGALLGTIDEAYLKSIGVRGELTQWRETAQSLVELPTGEG